MYQMNKICQVFHPITSIQVHIILKYFLVSYGVKNLKRTLGKILNEVYIIEMSR
jgi:hypothetical protein